MLQTKPFTTQPQSLKTKIQKYQKNHITEPLLDDGALLLTVVAQRILALLPPVLACGAPVSPSDFLAPVLLFLARLFDVPHNPVAQQLPLLLVAF